MKKTFLFIFIIFLSFSSVSLLKPQTVQAADGGPAGKFMLKAVSGPKMGEVTLTWIDADSADNYHLVYGTDSKKMQYGALNIGTNNVYTVGMLNPGAKYYFALVPVMDNKALYTSEWVSAASMGGQKITQSQGQLSQASAVVNTVTSSTTGPQWLTGKIGPSAGDVTLNWRHTDDANNYHLVYGTEPGKYTYGALNIGWVTSYTVHKLVPGMTYYFALVPVKNDKALYTTQAVKVMTGSTMQVVRTTADAVRQPKASISPISQSPTLPTTDVTENNAANSTVNDKKDNTVNNTVTYPVIPETTSGQ